VIWIPRQWQHRQWMPSTATNGCLLLVRLSLAPFTSAATCTFASPPLPFGKFRSCSVYSRIAFARGKNGLACEPSKRKGLRHLPNSFPCRVTSSQLQSERLFRSAAREPSVVSSVQPFPQRYTSFSSSPLTYRGWCLLLRPTSCYALHRYCTIIF